MKVSERMPTSDGRRRWSAVELESRIKACLWAKAARETNNKVTLMGFAELRGLLAEPARELSDKTLSGVLASMVDRHVLAKEEVAGRPKYALQLDLSAKDIEQALLSSDVRRLQYSAEMGVRGGVEDGYTVYGIRENTTHRFRQALKNFCEAARDDLLDLVDAELQETMKEIDRALRPGLKPKERRQIFDFLVVSLALSLFSEPSSQGIAYQAHLEKIFGKEFIPYFQGQMEEFFVGHSARHPRSTQHFVRNLERVLNSPKAAQREVGTLLAFYARMTPEMIERSKGVLRKARISYATLVRLAQRLDTIRVSIGMVIVISPALRLRVGPTEFQRSVIAGRQARSSPPVA
jgi:hypothetical protein